MIIPVNAIVALEAELSGLKFGNITLELQASVHDEKIKWRVIKTVSISENSTSGSQTGNKQKT